MKNEDAFRWQTFDPHTGQSNDLAGEGQALAHLKAELEDIRRDHPEISHWGLLGISSAWAGFSRTIYSSLWLTYGGRDDAFLGYVLLLSHNPSVRPHQGDHQGCAQAYHEWKQETAADLA